MLHTVNREYSGRTPEPAVDEAGHQADTPVDEANDQMNASFRGKGSGRWDDPILIDDELEGARWEGHGDIRDDDNDTEESHGSLQQGKLDHPTKTSPPPKNPQRRQRRQRRQPVTSSTGINSSLCSTKVDVPRDRQTLKMTPKASYVLTNSEAF